MIALAYILSGLSFLMSVLLLIHLRSGAGWIILFPKLTAGGLSPYWAVMGIAGAVIGEVQVIFIRTEYDKILMTEYWLISEIFTGGENNG